MEEKIIKCDCGEEVLVITNDDECGFFLGMFERQFTRYTWRNKLRLIWRIIRHGKPYTDQICISDANAKELAAFINKHIRKKK